MNFKDYFSVKEKTAETIESVECTPRDLFTVITEFKMFSMIINSGSSFYVLLEQNGKYLNIKSVHINLEDAKRSIKDNLTLKRMTIKSKIYMPTLKIFSYDKALFYYIYKVNQQYSQNFQLKDMLILLEKIIPKKKYYVKGVKNKKNSENIIDDVCYALGIGIKDAEHYVDILNQLSDIDRETIIKEIDKGRK